MTEIPEFWRTEIWHPLSVHLPLAALILATLFYLLGFIVKNRLWMQMGMILLFIGTLGAWIAIYTGNLADGIVSREICDPTVLNKHENAAYLVAWFFTAASVLIILLQAGWLKKIDKIVKVGVLILMLIGSGYLVYVGHLGARLVFQQAAGVYTPGEDCSEFND